jgi:hypothetical protein
MQVEGPYIAERILCSSIQKYVFETQVDMGSTGETCHL